MRKMYANVKRFADVNPIIFASWVCISSLNYVFAWFANHFRSKIQVMGITAFLMPFVVVPIRRQLGYRTNQYDKKTPKRIEE